MAGADSKEEALYKCSKRFRGTYEVDTCRAIYELTSDNHFLAYFFMSRENMKKAIEDCMNIRMYPKYNTRDMCHLA